MTTPRSSRRLSWLLATTSAFVVSLQPTPAFAVWTTGGSGSAGSTAAAMPTGRMPAATAGTGAVRLSWAAVTVAGGASVDGYLVRRYDATTGTEHSVGGTCSGIVTATACTDESVPGGNWTYTDTPVLANWTGAESARSTPVTIGAG